MELLIGLICVGLVLVVPIVALVKVNQAANDVDDLKQKVQRLEERLNEKGDQFTDTKPVSEPLGQAEKQTVAKPKPKQFNLCLKLQLSKWFQLRKKILKTLNFFQKRGL